MYSDELARAVNRTVGLCQERILGVGQEQYDFGDTQAFEEMTILELLTQAEQEALDLINYGVMTHIRLDRLKEALKRKAARELTGGSAALDQVVDDDDDEWADRAGDEGTCGDRNCFICYSGK